MAMFFCIFTLPFMPRAPNIVAKLRTERYLSFVLGLGEHPKPATHDHLKTGHR
jgi:hypothetical protein